MKSIETNTGWGRSTAKTKRKNDKTTLSWKVLRHQIVKFHGNFGVSPRWADRLGWMTILELKTASFIHGFCSVSIVFVAKSMCKTFEWISDLMTNLNENKTQKIIFHKYENAKYLLTKERRKKAEEEETDRSKANEKEKKNDVVTLMLTRKRFFSFTSIVREIWQIKPTCSMRWEEKILRFDSPSPRFENENNTNVKHVYLPNRTK